jgi:hypothetical protein
MSKNNKKQWYDQRFLGRRQFLMGIGGHMLMIPFLSSLAPRNVLAAPLPNRRLAMFPMEFGMMTNFLRPDNAIIKPSLIAHSPSIHYANLASLPKPISFVFDNTFDDLLNDLNIFYGLGGTGEAGHTYGIFNGSNANVPGDNTNRRPTFGRSLDVIIENSAQFKSSFSGKMSTIRPSTKQTYGVAMFWDRDASGNPIVKQPTMSDRTLFDNIFGLVDIAPTEKAKMDARKTLVADSVLEDINRLKNHKRISKSDKDMLDRYITSVNDLQKKLLDVKSCSKPSITYQYDAAGKKIASFSVDQLLDNFFEITTLAFACDQSRMLGLQNHFGSSAGAGLPHHFDGEDVVVDTNNSGITQKWYIHKIADFARKLKAFPDPSGQGSLLDHSLLMVMNEHSSRRAHSPVDLPTLTIGSLGGTVNSGKYIDFRQEARFINDSTPFGHPRKQLLISALQGMGVARSEYINDGDGNGFGMFSGAQAANHTDFASTHNDPLPFYTKP